MPTAIALVCTLKPGPAKSSSDKLAREVMNELDKLGGLQPRGGDLDGDRQIVVCFT